MIPVFFRPEYAALGEDVRTLGRGTLDSQGEVQADATIAHVAWFYQCFRFSLELSFLSLFLPPAFPLL